MGQKLHHRVDTWKKLLLDFGKRNKLINYKEGKRSNVNIEAPSYEKVFDKIVVREESMTFPYSPKVHFNDDGEEVFESIIKGDFETNKTVSDLQKTLKVLRYRANTSIEEQGVNILFLTFGMLKWRDNDDSSESFSSPIILVPVKLTIESITSPYTLAIHEDEIVVNPTLVQKLDNDFGIRFPEFDSTQDNISDYFDECDRIIKKKDWSIERDVHLTNLSFLKINMYKDLERNEDRLSSHPLISAIAGENDSISISDEFKDYDHDKKERPINVFQVVDADSSQQDAILLSKKGASFVLQGPPGTGKSQTITNIISEALADGKKVLFVAEKMAALQVVYNRLSNVGLADFCLTLHSHKANKKEILRELANSIAVDRKKVREEALAQLDILERKRDALNEYQEELHTPCSALKKTIFEINGQLAQLNAVPDIIFSIPDIESVDVQKLNNNAYLLQELAKTIGKRSEDYETNVWKGATIEYLTNELRHDIDSNVIELLPLLMELDESLSKCSAKLDLNIQHTLQGSKQVLDVLQVAQRSPLIPVKWLSDNITELFSNTEKYRETTTIITGCRELIEDNFKVDVFDINAKIQKERLVESYANVSSVVRVHDGDDLMSYLDKTGNLIKVIANDVEIIHDNASSLAMKLGIKVPMSVESLISNYEILKELIQIKDITPTQNWCNKDKFAQLKASLLPRKALYDDYCDKKCAILADYDQDVLDLDCFQILQRFRGQYNTVFRFFKGQYRKDIRLIRGFSKRGDRIQFKDAFELLHQLKNISDTKSKIEEGTLSCKEDYGEYYRGLDTQWDDLNVILNRFEQFLEIIEVVPEKLQTLLIGNNLPIEDVRHYLNAYVASDCIVRLKGLSESLIIALQYDDNIKQTLNTFSDAYKKCADFITIYSDLIGYRKEKAPYEVLLSELSTLEIYQDKISTLETQEDTIIAVFSSYYNGVQTDWDKLYQALCFARDFKQCLDKYSLTESFISKICTNNESVKDCEVLYEQIKGLENRIEKPLGWFSSLFNSNERFLNTNLVDLANYLNKCKDNKQLLEEWVDYCSTRKQCESAGLTPYVEQISNMPIDNNFIVDAYLKRFYRLWLDKMLNEFPAVRDFRGRIHEQNIQEFCKLDVEQFKIAQARVRERLVNQMPDFNAVTSARDEVGILKRELSKQRRIMPLRKLFMAIPNVLSTLRPCFMMSPLSVSVFLEAHSYEFDLVIFDEASQVHSEDAIGAIMRGKQVIIVGDTKQLPPTNFFATSLNDDDYDVDIDEDIKDNDAGAYESILDEAVTVLPERSLRWHYRSRDERLIAFSNVKIYNGSLITFPSSVEKAPDLGVEYVYVKEGVYDRSGKRYNIIEAQRVAQLVFDHFRKHPNRSLGVVTFSEAQQNAVDAAIRQMRLNNSSMEKFFGDNLDEPFFIKNLENVQGDERDTIIFSIGYAKDHKGIMYMNFGPLSREGGYRRLNVAITRAKYNVKLVGSIAATDIDVERTSAEGVKMLRSYIEYAQNGILALENEINYNNNLDFDSPFEEAVFDFLSSKGYNVVTQVGCSGFRIDMAVKHPTQNGKFAIGIECDGASYHSSRTVRERDRLRQTILEDMGWTIYRIWSTDWIKNQKSEEENLVLAIERALSCVPFSTALENDVVEKDTKEITSFEIEEDVVSSESTERGYGFDLYKNVSVYDCQGRDKTSTIKNVIKATQPIHFEHLSRILAPLWGNQKATNVIRDTIKYYFKYYMGNVVKLTDGFVTLSDFDSLTVRVPETAEDIRPIEYISKDELALALTTIVQHSFGITPKDLITVAAREFGFKRMGGKIFHILSAVYEQLISDGIFKEIDGKVNAFM